MAVKTVLVTGARAPVALHLARLLHGAGMRVVLADTPSRPMAAASVACAAYRQLPAPRFSPEAYADAVASFVDDEAIDLVIPTCEEIFYLADIWRNRAPAARLFAPGMDLLAEVHSKHDFIRRVEYLSLPAPETILLRDASDLQTIRSRSREMVFKPVWSRFANRVLLRPQPEQLTPIKPTAAAPWVAQQFIDGDEISAYAVAVAGRLKALSLYRSLYKAGKGAGVCFEPVDDPAARRFVEAFVAGTGWTGQISFDLMRTPDGSILPLECNPRATSGLHFFRDPRAFASILDQDSAEVAPDVSGLQTVRLALWLYGLPAALGRGEIRRFAGVLKSAEELLDWPGDPAPRKAQFASLAEIAGTAFRQRISLQEAATRDIEWNGPLQSSR